MRRNPYRSGTRTFRRIMLDLSVGICLLIAVDPSVYFSLCDRGCRHSRTESACCCPNHGQEPVSAVSSCRCGAVSSCSSCFSRSICLSSGVRKVSKENLSAKSVSRSGDRIAVAAVRFGTVPVPGIGRSSGHSESPFPGMGLREYVSLCKRRGPPAIIRRYR